MRRLLWNLHLIVIPFTMLIFVCCVFRVRSWTLLASVKLEAWVDAVMYVRCCWWLRATDTTRLRLPANSVHGILACTCVIVQQSKPSDRIIGFDPCPTVNASSEIFNQEFISNLPLTMWESILQVKYEDHDLAAERKVVLQQLADNFICNASDTVSWFDGPACVVSEQHSEE